MTLNKVTKPNCLTTYKMNQKIPISDIFSQIYKISFFMNSRPAIVVEPFPKSLFMKLSHDLPISTNFNL